MKRSVLTLCIANLFVAAAAVSAQETDLNPENTELPGPDITDPIFEYPEFSESPDTEQLEEEQPDTEQPEDASASGPSDVDRTIQDVEDGEVRDGRPIEVFTERYDSGEVRVRREVTLDSAGNYILQGAWTMFNREGDVVARGLYNDNERQGDWMRIHDEHPEETPQIDKDTGGDFAKVEFKNFRLPFTSSAVFEKGKLNGVWTMHDADDNLILSLTFRDGERDGPATWFYPDGDTKAIVEFRGGVIDGMRMEYDENSDLIREEKWESGRKLAVRSEYYGDGEESIKQSEAVYLHARFVVDIPDDWWSGMTASYRSDGPEERHGTWTSWHENGQKKLEGNFDSDLREGEFTWWYPNGQLRTKGRYQADQPTGSWVWYHENGQKACQGSYRDGTPDGHWSFWEPTGQLMNRVDYSAANRVPEASEPPPSGSDEDDLKAELPVEIGQTAGD